MIRRHLVVTLALAGAACLPQVQLSDAGDSGVDGGTGPKPMPGCVAPCGETKVCDPVRRICVDGCGGCDSGVCLPTDAGGFTCGEVALSCNGQTCGPGESYCFNAECTCLPPTRANQDTCAPVGRVCIDGKCTNPRKYDECRPEFSQEAPCQTGSVCTPIPGWKGTSLCVPTCPLGTCVNRGDLCYGGTCIPSGFFQRCEVIVDAGFLVDGGQSDAGALKSQVLVGNLCQLKDSQGTFTEAEPSGNCTYNFIHFRTQIYAMTQCRAPGYAPENGACKQDFSTTALASQCGTGLECALLKSATQGVCLRACNAVPPVKFDNPQPACAPSEACLNIYREEDAAFASVLGVCAKRCNVFDPTSVCAPYGNTPSVCVPTEPYGDNYISANGDGACLPRRSQSSLGQPCGLQDPFRGAACDTGQVCSAENLAQASVCTQVCDLACAGASPPASCATSRFSTCPEGKTCKKTLSVPNVRLGLCR